MWLSVGTGAGCCDSGNETAASIKSESLLTTSVLNVVR